METRLPLEGKTNFHSTDKSLRSHMEPQRNPLAHSSEESCIKDIALQRLQISVLPGVAAQD